MKCLLKYRWVKLPRDKVLPGKGVMGSWFRLASRAAFRNGQAHYYKYTNQVMAGAWVGGIVGFKSILSAKRRKQALEIAEKLSQLDYIDFELDQKTKKLTYKIKDWVVSCCGAPCMGSEAVYTTPGYGFLCVPRNITERLVEAQYCFDEADAWLDLWCHTVWQETDNAFSRFAPAVQYGRYGAVLTLETLGRRWGWEKTKVWRFFRKHADAFPLYKLPGSFGCLILNAGYPTGTEVVLPDVSEIERIVEEIRILGGKAHSQNVAGHEWLGRCIALYSKKVIPPVARAEDGTDAANCRVAVSGCPITHAYFSPCWNCGNFKGDWSGKGSSPTVGIQNLPRAGPPICPALGGIEYGSFEGDPLW